MRADAQVAEFARFAAGLIGVFGAVFALERTIAGVVAARTVSGVPSAV